MGKRKTEGREGFPPARRNIELVDSLRNLCLGKTLMMYPVPQMLNRSRIREKGQYS